MKKVFIDGAVGTTGLRIADRLGARKEIELLRLPDELRKDPSAKKDMFNTADIIFFCLPDDAAKEAAGLIENPDTAVIDTSTAHRTDDAWVYGFPELTGQRDKIRNSKRIANPGCHASGFNALVAPLVERGIIPEDAHLSAFSITGYSGGGKKMIADYESAERDILLDAPRMYGISQKHKHLPEMKKMCGLVYDPAFCPIVAPFYSGMEVVVTLYKDLVNGSVQDIKDAYIDQYKTGLVHFAESPDENGFYSAGALSLKDNMEVSVSGNDDRILLVSRFDNLGKGASGAAIQNMNILLGLPEDEGLDI